MATVRRTTLGVRDVGARTTPRTWWIPISTRTAEDYVRRPCERTPGSSTGTGIGGIPGGRFPRFGTAPLPPTGEKDRMYRKGQTVHTVSPMVSSFRAGTQSEVSWDSKGDPKGIHPAERDVSEPHESGGWRRILSTRRWPPRAMLRSQWRNTRGEGGAREPDASDSTRRRGRRKCSSTTRPCETAPRWWTSP